MTALCDKIPFFYMYFYFINICRLLKVSVILSLTPRKARNIEAVTGDGLPVTDVVLYLSLTRTNVRL